jgi:hypothetical protein
LVGRGVRDDDGEDESVVGRPVGRRVGDAVGKFVWPRRVGNHVVGTLLGEAEGRIVGRRVGERVGTIIVGEGENLPTPCVAVNKYTPLLFALIEAAPTTRLFTETATELVPKIGEVEVVTD